MYFYLKIRINKNGDCQELNLRFLTVLISFRAPFSDSEDSEDSDSDADADADSL